MGEWMQIDAFRTTVLRHFFDPLSAQRWKGGSRQNGHWYEFPSFIPCVLLIKVFFALNDFTVDILLFALENPNHLSNLPATVVLIAGDRDYSYLISTLRLRGHDIVLIFPPNQTTANLKHLASVVLNWRADVLDCVDPGQHVQRLLPKTGSSFLPSPASSTFSREITPSTGGSVSSLELSRASPEPSGTSGRDSLTNLSIVRSPSASADFSVCDLTFDEKEDVESFVCVDEVDEASSHVPSNADSKPDERPALTTSVTELFSSFFKRRSTETIPSPPLPALAKGKDPSSSPDLRTSQRPVDVSSPARVKDSSTTSLIAGQKIPAPEPTTAGPSSGWSLGSAKASLEKDILQWSAGTTPYPGGPGCTGTDRSPPQEVQSEYAESEICLDVFGVSKPTTVSQGIVNSTDSIQKRPASLPMGDAYNTNIKPIPSRGSQPTGPVYTCELSTTTFNIPPPAPPASKKQSGSGTFSTKVINNPPPAPSASKKQSGSSTLASKVVNNPPPALPASSKLSGSSTASSTKGKSSVQSNVQNSAQPDARFTVLVEVLRKLRKEGQTRPEWSVIGSELMKRCSDLYKKAGCSRMKTYLELASKSGLIVLGQVGTDGAWVQLNE